MRAGRLHGTIGGAARRRARYFDDALAKLGTDGEPHDRVRGRRHHRPAPARAACYAGMVGLLSVDDRWSGLRGASSTAAARGSARRWSTSPSASSTRSSSRAEQRIILIGDTPLRGPSERQRRCPRGSSPCSSGRLTWSRPQESVNASMDLALGLCLLVLGALAGTPGRARSSGSSRWSRATTGRVACGSACSCLPDPVLGGGRCPAANDCLVRCERRHRLKPSTMLAGAHPNQPALPRSERGARRGAAPGFPPPLRMPAPPRERLEGPPQERRLPPRHR